MSKAPWRYEEIEGVSYIIDADGDTIMSNEAYYPWCPGEYEDWYKIAAAPELLKVLKEAREELRLIRMKDTDACYDPTLRIRMDLVIAKATNPDNGQV